MVWPGQARQAAINQTQKLTFPDPPCTASTSPDMGTRNSSRQEKEVRIGIDQLQSTDSQVVSEAVENNLKLSLSAIVLASAPWALRCQSSPICDDAGFCSICR